MGDIRQVIQGELKKLMFENEDSNFFTKHPLFSNPQKAAEYAIEYMEKYNIMKRFHDQVLNIAFSSEKTSEEKIEEIISLK